MYLPIFIHFHGSISSSWANSLNKLSGWSLCLLHTCLIKDRHLAMIISWNPWVDKVVHQYRWFRTPFIHSLMSSYPFSFLAFSNFLTTDLATCHMSKRCVLFVWLYRIHLAMPRWRSAINTAIATPGLHKKVKQFFVPCNSIAWLLSVWLA